MSPSRCVWGQGWPVGNIILSVGSLPTISGCPFPSPSTGHQMKIWATPSTRSNDACSPSPVASDGDMYQLWNMPSIELGLPLLAGVYEEGLEAHGEVLH